MRPSYRLDLERVLLNGYEPITSVPPTPPNPPYVSKGKDKEIGEEIVTKPFAEFKLDTNVYSNERKHVGMQVDAYIVTENTEGEQIWTAKDVELIAELKNNKNIPIDGGSDRPVVMPTVTFKVPPKDTTIAFVATFRLAKGDRRTDSKVSVSYRVIKAQTN